MQVHVCLNVLGVQYLYIYRVYIYIYMCVSDVVLPNSPRPTLNGASRPRRRVSKKEEAEAWPQHSGNPPGGLKEGTRWLTWRSISVSFAGFQLTLQHRSHIIGRTG